MGCRFGPVWFWFGLVWSWLGPVWFCFGSVWVWFGSVWFLLGSVWVWVGPVWFCFGSVWFCFGSAFTAKDKNQKKQLSLTLHLSDFVGVQFSQTRGFRNFEYLIFEACVGCCADLVQ